MRNYMDWIGKPGNKKKIDSGGSILVFLPGIRDQDRLFKLLFLKNRIRNAVVLQLHSTKRNQNLRVDYTNSLNVDTEILSNLGSKNNNILEEKLTGIRKIILATNIAETGITIPDVTVVIDTGKSKQKRYHDESGEYGIYEDFVSKSNVKQRSGRAGRTMPGISFRLFKQKDYEGMSEYPEPEINRIPLENFCLKSKLFYNGNIEDFMKELISPPEYSKIQNSINELTKNGLLDKDQKMTSIGENIGRLSLDYNMAKMLLMSIKLSCLDPILTYVSIKLKGDGAFRRGNNTRILENLADGLLMKPGTEGLQDISPTGYACYQSGLKIR
ncbi:ATP-dependent RNA helicase DHX29 [Smittium mucronatum]|uniref:ATP-dependent RNA helicase DHX29 n=1 Tax=Smittium mucronatum TaxID=133383 RepID=A0A1R0GYG7_9FUNG|nr:ATP-dependent RNA helicase DHX29 [Smittium mucronatum]